MVYFKVQCTNTTNKRNKNKNTKNKLTKRNITKIKNDVYSYLSNRANVKTIALKTKQAYHRKKTLKIAFFIKKKHN